MDSEVRNFQRAEHNLLTAEKIKGHGIDKFSTHTTHTFCLTPNNPGPE